MRIPEPMAVIAARGNVALIGQTEIMHALAVYLHKEVKQPKELQRKLKSLLLGVNLYPGASKCAVLSIDASPTS